MKSSIDGTGADKHLGMGAALAVVLVLAAISGLVGCTSDDPNLVGTALVTDSIDTVLATLGVDEVTMYSALQIENPDTPTHKNVPVYRQEVLYMGGRNGTRCDGLLANFDFDIEFTADYPETLFTEENIKSVKLVLIKLKYYGARIDTVFTGQPVDLYYQVQTVAAPFDSLGYGSYPVEAPVPTGPILNSDFTEPNNDSEVFLPFYDFFKADLLGYIQGKEKVGLVVNFGALSDTGLVGFASRDLVHYSELDPLEATTIPAPKLLVEFQDGTTYLIPNYSDTSTFVEVPDAPGDVSEGFLLRTGLRNYPVLLFDLTDLPPNAFINRALLTVTNDTTSSFGPLSSIGVLEWDSNYFGDPYRTIPLRDINDPYQYYSFYVTGQNSLDPELNRTINFDVTQAILRVVNHVYDGTRGLLLTGGEDFLPVGSSSPVDPDFYYEEFRFLGTAAADPNDRPQLKITYSIVNDIGGGSK